jgi:hypothetical protein
MARFAFNSEMLEILKFTSTELNINSESVPDLIEKLCNYALELDKFVKKLSLPSKKCSLKDLFQELLLLEKMLTKQDRVMFFVFKESYNNHTISLKSIIRRLSWQKDCTTQEAKTLIDKLEKQGLILKIEKCPQCSTPFYYLPDECENCDHIFIGQKINFQDKRFRPRFAIEITDAGKSYVNELIEGYMYIHKFFHKWSKFVSM